MRRRTAMIGGGIALLVFVGAIVLLSMLWRTQDGGFRGSSDESIVDKNTLAALPKKAASNASLSRLGDNVKPPTNSWISGLALQEKPLAVFPMPYSFQALDTGFEVGLPQVTSTATTITGGHTPGLDVTVNNASAFTLSRFDKVSATLTYQRGDTELGHVTVTQGSPFVFYRAKTDTELLVKNVNGGDRSSDSYRFTVANTDYIVTSTSDGTIQLDGSTLRITASAGELVTFYALPTGDEDVLKEFAHNELKSVEVASEKKEDAWLTKLKYVTENNQPTVVSFLPYSVAEGGTVVDIQYQSIYGDMKTRHGSLFTTSAPEIEPLNELDVRSLNDQQKQALIDDLQKDSEDTSIEPQDTYFAGKQLARLANLLSIAKQLNQDAIASKLQAALKTELTKRLEGSYLYYDTELKGIAAQHAAFGSEDFNDHHFHYGSFIHAASILGTYDASFVDEYKDEVNLLVADIASYENYEEFPQNRYYDPYSGHSWAAGLAPFQDGNNQESSSEAMTAWNAVALWAKLIGNESLEQSGRWMLANEARTAQVAWRSVDTSEPYLKAYTSPVASLNFGGKRTYATFFNDAASAKIGIQLILMNPLMQTFKTDGDAAIREKVAALDTNFNQPLGDYVLMYFALADKDAALEKLAQQQDEFIDDGNSRTYLRAWIYSR